MHNIPIIFLSGMAADAQLFKAQLAAFPNLRIQPWAPPLPGESLRAYAKRLAAAVDPGRPCLVGGASFGGVVALEMAPHLSALGCILIGSIRSPAGIPWRWRTMRFAAALGPEWLRGLAGISVRASHPLLNPPMVRQLRRLAGPEAAFARWATCAILRWQPSPAVKRVRVFQIHGEADQVFPIARARPDAVVPGGSHALPLFSPAAVNEFIAEVLGTVAR